MGLDDRLIKKEIVHQVVVPFNWNRMSIKEKIDFSGPKLRESIEQIPWNIRRTSETHYCGLIKGDKGGPNFLKYVTICMSSSANNAYHKSKKVV